MVELPKLSPYRTREEHLRPSPTMLLCHDPVVFWLEKLQEDIVRSLDTKDIVRLPSGLRKPLKSSWK